jgi:glycosyltransferase involved in cell wall biosynthesis
MGTCAGGKYDTGARVGAVITVHNGERFIARAIESLQRQTVGDWCCVIINDGSTDGTARLLKKVRDVRVSVVHVARIGRIRALNLGCRAVRSDYIAILDSDDVAEPRRFELQAQFLDESPAVGLVASYVRFRYETDGHTCYFKPPLLDSGVRSRITRFCPFAHSSVMFRKSLWEAIGGYNTDLPCNEDYNFYIDLMHLSTVKVVPEVLTTCSIHDRQSFRALTSERLRARTAAKLRFRAVRVLHRPAWEMVFGVAEWFYSLVCDHRVCVGLKRVLRDRVLVRHYWGEERVL